ncbi:hypothetical protein A3K80_09015 [Candidatus Bathyarchaeota archaeon RBG_13_38_9]|nr:MAG: hypothetical protein A3K80_09015 [Candidatus Bathyarchaeota archaeon RBG_13_38_9]
MNKTINSIENTIKNKLRIVKYPNPDKNSPTKPVIIMLVIVCNKKRSKRSRFNTDRGKSL